MHPFLAFIAFLVFELNARALGSPHHLPSPKDLQSPGHKKAKRRSFQAITDDYIMLFLECVCVWRKTAWEECPLSSRIRCNESFPGLHVPHSIQVNAEPTFFVHPLRRGQ
ncbi:hypothetical protein BaRGS_00022724 [Batillaria attramentaria]|uniref:Secreted protein n=1 Tax=Batillaria attramentaria TaxID=370345 RepID=A0ABD0KGN2_9CAEN